jgi:hypothetical protein
VIVVVIAAVAFMIAFTVVGQAEASRKYAGTANTQSTVRYAAESGLAYIGDMITYPAYSHGFTGATAGELANPAPRPVMPNPPGWPSYLQSTGASATASSYTGSPAKSGYTTNSNLFLHNRCDGAGRHIWVPLFTAPNPTMYLRGYSAQGGGPTGSAMSSIGRPNFMPDIPVWVWLCDNNLQGDDYRLAAYAEYGPNVHQTNANGALSTGATDRVLVIQELRENQPFSSWMMAALADNVDLGPGLINGNVRSNKAIYTPHPPASGPTITGSAQALTGSADGFKYYGDTTQTTDFNGSALQGATLTSTTVNPPATPIATVAAEQAVSALAGVPPAVTGLNTGIPTGYTNAVSGLGANDANFFNVANSGASHGTTWTSLSGTTVNATITIDNTTTPGKPTMTIVATGSTSGTKTISNIPFPATGSAVVYVSGNVTVNSTDGTFSGKLTVVAGKTLSIDSNLIYKDNTAPAGSQFAYNMLDGSGNNLGDPQLLSGGNWYTSNYTYQPNANFAPANGAALGLMAHDDINTTTNVGNNFLLNASTFSATGSSFDGAHTGPDVTAGTATVGPVQGPAAPARGNYALAGSLVGNLSAAGHAGSIGFGNGGLVTFDTNAAKSPPPAWVRINAPAFGATYTRNPNMSPAIYARVTAAGAITGTPYTATMAGGGWGDNSSVWGGTANLGD